jgi:hypothetical protein
MVICQAKTTDEQEYKFRYVDCAFNVKLQNFDWQYWQMLVQPDT